MRAKQPEAWFKSQCVYFKLWNKNKNAKLPEVETSPLAPVSVGKARSVLRSSLYNLINPDVLFLLCLQFPPASTKCPKTSQWMRAVMWHSVVWPVADQNRASPGGCSTPQVRVIQSALIIVCVGQDAWPVVCQISLSRCQISYWRQPIKKMYLPQVKTRMLVHVTFSGSPV